MKAYPFAIILLSISCLVNADEPKNLLRPVNDAKSWAFLEVSPAEGSMNVLQQETRFTVHQCDGTGWHVQALQRSLDLKEGIRYTIKFKVRSMEPRWYLLRATIDGGDFHSIGLNEELFASKHFREESVTFTARQVLPGKSRIVFSLGQAKGTLIIKDMTMTEDLF